MQPEQITFISYFSGSILFGLLSLIAIYLWKIKTVHISLFFAALTSTIWHLGIAMNYQGFTLGKGNLLILETARYTFWVVAILCTLRFTIGQQIPQKIRLTILTFCGMALLAAITLKLLNSPLIENTNTFIWTSLLLAITGLISVEQLYKNTENYRLIKLWSVTIGGMLVYDIYLFAYSLIFDQIDVELWQGRGAINACAALILIIGSLLLAYTKQRSSFTISRPVAFYTTSMTVAGGFLSLMAASGYYMQLYGGNWGAILQILVLFLALTTVAAAFISSTIRSRVKVWVSKYFFSHKYDYRSEWLRLINHLSRAPDAKDFHARAISGVASIFKSSKGILWVLQNGQMVPVASLHMESPESYLQEPIDSPFCKALLEHEWVFSSYAPDNEKLSELNKLLPGWLIEIPDLWLVLPLLTEQNLVGFMVLTKPIHETALSWEDLDLLKAVGRQVASYLDRHQAAEQIAESRQLDAFNKLTAFVMHDLKNLIAQQALVVQNAAKHKDNPAFIEDAIQTIDNSVTRMSNLLRKLQRDEPHEPRSLELSKILIDATKKCKDLTPTPSLRLQDNDIIVNADPDNLTMIFVHIIKNAQEATDMNGFVDITLSRDGNNAIIVIEDNGEGMDVAFMRERLFKPFVTTKSGKGMGIGVFQTNEIINSLGGKMTVESTPEVGSTFTLSIPATQA
jgi:putative PEP-CTERM system histidine kinase